MQYRLKNPSVSIDGDFLKSIIGIEFARQDIFQCGKKPNVVRFDAY